MSSVSSVIDNFKSQFETYKSNYPNLTSEDKIKQWETLKQAFATLNKQHPVSSVLKAKKIQIINDFKTFESKNNPDNTPSTLEKACNIAKIFVTPEAIQTYSTITKTSVSLAKCCFNFSVRKFGYYYTFTPAITYATYKIYGPAIGTLTGVGLVVAKVAAKDIQNRCKEISFEEVPDKIVIGTAKGSLYAAKKFYQLLSKPFKAKSA